jgi:crossover junction endonuclease MUS81
MVSILIDSREHQLYERLKESPFTIEQKQLDIGDIHLVKDDFYIILERKTFADFAASLKDGRYREQKYRLKESQAPVAYLLEGVPNIPELSVMNQSVYGIQPSAFISAILHTSFREGFHMFFASDMEETMRWILELAKRLEKDSGNFKIQEGGNYIEMIRPKQQKIKHITPELCQSMILMQIPGISSRLATELIQKFGSVRQLFETLNPLSQVERLESLQTIPLLGPKKAHQILEYLKL